MLVQFQYFIQKTELFKTQKEIKTWIFQQVTDGLTHFLTLQEEANIKGKAGEYWKSLVVTIDEENDMTTSEEKEKSQSGMHLDRKYSELVCSQFIPLVQIAVKMTDLLRL